MRAFSVQERRARLGRRHFLAGGSQARDAVEVAGGLVGLHATDPATVYLSARARGVDSADLERVLYADPGVLRMIGMRRTLFVLPLELAAVVKAACTDAIAEAQRRRYVKLIEEAGISTDGRRWLDEAAEAALRAIEFRGPVYATELSAEVPQLRESVLYGEGKPWAGRIAMTTWVLFLLAAEGRIARGRPRGTWTSSQWSWSTTESWLGKKLPELEPEGARAELASRWLAAYGPASVADLKWWSGWNLGQTRRALEAIDAVEVDLDGTAGVVLADDLDDEPEPEPWAALLPPLDSTVMGWKERDWYLGGHAPALFDRNGNAGPTVWWNGRIVGGWAARKDGELAYRVLEDVGADAGRAIEDEVERLRAWLGETRVVPRFSTPLATELKN